MHRIKSLTIVFSLLLASTWAQTQTQVLFEAGGTYITNNLYNPQSRLYDFLALTLNPRILLAEGRNTSISLDLPLSIRSKSNDERTTRFGTLLPALLMLNYGAGSVSGANKNSLGFTAGAGWGYFYQSTRAEMNEIPQYKESVSSHGPIIQAGIRIPHRKRTLFQYNDSRVYLVSLIKFSYLVNLSEHQKNIGSLSLLIGLGF